VKEVLPDVDLDTMEAVFLPENAAKLAECGISLLDSPADIGFMVLKWKGIDPAMAGQAELDQMIAAFDAIRPSILTFDNTNYTSRMANGEICVANSYSGDYSFMIDIAAEAGIKLNLGYFVPKTGAPAWLDCWCIPDDAANKDDAYTFIDYMTRPEVAAACTNYTRYAMSAISAHGTVLRDCVAEGLRFIFTPIGVEDDEEPKDRASETHDDEGACRAGC
jgi:putrescine transport system substrate-binding protein